MPLEPLTNQIIYIDAQNGTILTSIESIQNCTNVNAYGATNYSGNVNFDACLSSGIYTLESSIQQVYNANNTYNYDSNSSFTDTDNFFEADSTAVEVYWATQKSYEYFYGTHSRNSLDDNGMPLISIVHHGNNVGNAFWDEAHKCMVYGDGDNIRYGPLTSPDIVGHEITHGINSFTAMLINPMEMIGL